MCRAMLGVSRVISGLTLLAVTEHAVRIDEFKKSF